MKIPYQVRILEDGDILKRERFEQLVVKAVESLPEEFITRLQNVDIVVEERATPAQTGRLSQDRGYTLLGLYEGIPLTKRSSSKNSIGPFLLL